ncbi:MAG TPA: mannose-1-phosphate guanylyltransferase [Chitinophagaceae bacterium]|nr:mannose-1-phosphate guanylyltransferase [Chitinophagaceae bacterium]
MDEHNYAVIMAGGIGSRFWPESRIDYPKQFLDILDTGKSLIQWTYERFQRFIPDGNIYVVTHKKYIDKVREHLPDLPMLNIVPEPSRKNTAPCVAYISYKIHKKDSEARIICSPSDHLVLDQDNFSQVCREGLDFVGRENVLLTLGVTPNRPDTGYGYIQFNTDMANNHFHEVKTFTEKPDKELATTFLKSGDFLWNSGIFLWRSAAILNAFKLYQPDLTELFDQVYDKLNTEEEADVMNFVYSQCTNISIDFAIMEKAENVYVRPANFGWSDLGSWGSAYDNMEKDYLGNTVNGDNVRIIDATNCMVKAPDKKLLLLQGVHDLIIVDTKDVLLICEKEKEQQIKDFVADIKRNKGEKYL